MAIFNGTPGNDTLIGTGSADTLNGGDGDDVLEGLGGADSLNGGNGIDTASYILSGFGFNIFLMPGGPTSGDAAGDTFSSIENVIGTNFNDGIYGNTGNNTLYGRGGRDTLYGWGGTDYLYGGDETDNLVGSSGIDVMDGGNGIDTASYQLSVQGLTASMADQSLNTGEAAGDIFISIEDLTGTEYDDVLYGDSQAVNNLDGLAGNDRIYGGDGYDVMIGGPGADYLDGGGGRDLADYETAGLRGGPAIGVGAFLYDSRLNTGEAAGDVYVSIEDLAGSDFDDILAGNDFDNNFIGLTGNDRIYGLGGTDGLEGNGGHDILDGGSGTDLLVGGAGNDTIFGNDGFDIAQFSGSRAGYAIAYVAIGNYFTVTGADGFDQLYSIDYVRFDDGEVAITSVASGYSAPQFITGDTGNNRFASTAARQYFEGHGGTDLVGYGGMRAQFNVAQNAVTGEIYVNDPAGISGYDVLNRIERVGFSDGKLAFDLDGNAGLAYRLYQAAFDRAPDTAGLGFWINSLDSGYDRLAMVNYFLVSPEFQQSYGNLDTSQFVNQVYQNVLNRAPDAGGYAFWTGQLNAGMTRADLLLGFSESPENRANVIGVIQNGIWYT